MSDSDVLSYEFPCNEKIRTYLRLEALFHRFDWLAAQDSPVAHHCAIGALFDLTDATARSDLRNELVQGLERRRQQTEAGTPRHQHLTDLIHDITRIVGKSGQNATAVMETIVFQSAERTIGWLIFFPVPSPSIPMTPIITIDPTIRYATAS